MVNGTRRLLLRGAQADADLVVRSGAVKVAAMSTTTPPPPPPPHDTLSDQYGSPTPSPPSSHQVSEQQPPQQSLPQPLQALAPSFLAGRGVDGRAGIAPHAVECGTNDIRVHHDTTVVPVSISTAQELELRASQAQTLAGRVIAVKTALLASVHAAKTEIDRLLVLRKKLELAQASANRSVAKWARQAEKALLTSRTQRAIREAQQTCLAAWCEGVCVGGDDDDDDDDRDEDDSHFRMALAPALATRRCMDSDSMAASFKHATAAQAEVIVITIASIANMIPGVQAVKVTLTAAEVRCRHCWFG